MTMFMLWVIFMALIAVSVADVILKKVGNDYPTFMSAAISPLAIVAGLMYLFQVWVFLYAFIKKADLSTIAILQTVLYALITLTCAVVFFGEKMSMAKALWASVAVISVIDMNTSK